MIFFWFENRYLQNTNHAFFVKVSLLPNAVRKTLTKIRGWYNWVNSVEKQKNGKTKCVQKIVALSFVSRSNLCKMEIQPTVEVVAGTKCDVIYDVTKNVLCKYLTDDYCTLFLCHIIENKKCNECLALAEEAE